MVLGLRATWRRGPALKSESMLWVQLDGGTATVIDRKLSFSADCYAALLTADCYAALLTADDTNRQRTAEEQQCSTARQGRQSKHRASLQCEGALLAHLLLHSADSRHPTVAVSSLQLLTRQPGQTRCGL